MAEHSQPWVDGLTFADVLARTATAHAPRDALVFPQLALRRHYAAFHAEVREAARALLALGVRRGEHLGIWATNWPQWVVSQFAAASVGAVLVNINPAYRAHELAYVLNQADITTLILTDRFKTSDYFALLRGICPELATAKPGELRSPACPLLRRVISIKSEPQPGMWTWDEFRSLAANVADVELDRRQAECQPDDVVNIQFTSGTTGFPKGAMLTHRNLLMNAFYVGQRLEFTELDRLCIPVPFYHCFGCVLGTLVCVVYGSAMVVPAEMFDPLATLQAIQWERCTALYGVPTMFLAELEHPRFAEFDLRSLRTGIMAGSPCPIELMRAVVNRMGARSMTIGYGLTEASPIITQTCSDDSLEHRVGTVGKPLPGVEVRIVKPGSLDPVPVGEPGELIARGHGVMKGYYKKPAETAAAITPDGWLRTGDLALETPDGYYRITGRLKDLIIRGGENIYPREIEEFLYTHPAIADVQVVGLPDAHYGEEVCAWVRPKPGQTLSEEEVREFCRGKIAHYKVPRYVVIVDEYPTTVTGKVQKFKLREMGIARFGLEAAAQIETA
ncbi:MAG: AMP-binding protein [Gemmataceae bacterium]|nr:AMP-binding protein [Gemmataceae bacterium]MDW8266696.1 AMP-binding protein [Gemmataceae bacterium]